ncbi:MAG: YqgE/AlgH family protein [SAR86 cluster bacterium]|uniref:UPF0301 protein COA96_01650 n=1 Tax=SAR86 cluster bacterium TaxID=2030880 RepID=A0A2A5B9J5_9GAMM|nr:MAG: YqgE/AlgH family protein [SAR86 cluster bacterium]
MNTKSDSGFLENQFLIAMPQMVDSYFAHSVTYLWKHNNEGALGIVINKPLLASVAEIFAELDIVCNIDKELFQEQRVLAGGPVERDKGFIIHDNSESWESSVNVAEGISICTSKTILQEIAAGGGPKRYAVALGCAGWEAGQLEKEIINNAWLTAPAEADIIFSHDYENKAQQAASILGINLQQISPAAGHS